ncbi:hypothetical protein Syun_024088 [Stephania yunnanensis]|uniref:Histone H2A C-terminal domain-containing protein n=1 Tax=Stephania yunnanensis TaxID=152371 RepID=A0AAP0FKR2_9MAGN
MRDNKKTRVVPRHIQIGGEERRGARQVARRAMTIASGGVMPNIHNLLLCLRKLVVVLPIDIHVNFTCGGFSTMAITKMESFGIGRGSWLVGVLYEVKNGTETECVPSLKTSSLIGSETENGFRF